MGAARRLRGQSCRSLEIGYSQGWFEIPPGRYVGSGPYVEKPAWGPRACPRSSATGQEEQDSIGIDDVPDVTYRQAKVTVVCNMLRDGRPPPVV